MSKECVRDIHQQIRDLQDDIKNIGGKMYRIILLSILICCSLIAQEAFEQEIAWTCRGGISFLVGDNSVSKYWNESLCYGGAIRWRVVPSLSIGASCDFYKYRFDDVEYSSRFKPPVIGEWTAEGGQTDIFTIFGELKTIIPTHSVSPYISGGAGYLKRNTKEIDMYFNSSYFGSTEKIVDDAFAIFFGAGIDFNVVKPVILFIECRYIMGFMDNENIQIIPINFGLTLKGRE